jgi:hypothetical protein
MTDGPTDEAELLKAQLAQLEARNQELEQQHQASVGRKIARGLRRAACILLIVLGVLCLVLSPVVIWGRNLLLDTDRYVQTMEPLAKDADIQQTIITAVDNQVTSHVDVKSILNSSALPPKAAAALAGPLQGAVSSLVTNVTTRFVQSSAFETLWVTVNRAAHQQIVYVLTGSRPADAAIHLNSNGKIVLDLSPIVGQVKQRLVDAGLSVASAVPVVGSTIELADAKGVEHARSLTRQVDRLADFLPWIGLVLVAGGIATARKKRRALIVSALSLGAGMIVIGLGLTFGRDIYLDQVSSATLSRAAAGSLYDILIRYLRWGIRLVLLLALLIAFGAWLSGSSTPARKLRTTAAHLPRSLGARLNVGPVGAFVVRYATALRIGVVALMLIILLLIDTPTLGVVILLAVLTVLLLLTVELLRAAANHPVDSHSTPY